MIFGKIQEMEKNCDCKVKQAEWFVFNKFLAVPEYIIEFEYKNKVEIFLLSVKIHI